MKKQLQTQALAKKRCFCWFAIIILLLSATPAHDLLGQSYDLSPGNTWILDDGIFDSGTSTINEGAKNRLDLLGTYLAERPDLKIEIQGYWEKSANEAAAKRNSQSRADAVKAYLIKNFSINPGRISTIGYGSAFQIGNEDVKDGIAANRRIEVVGLTPITRRPLTRASRASSDAVAYISLIEGDMQTKATWDDDFVRARYQQQLFEGHKLNVYIHGRSAISFLNGGKIEISENSRLILYGKTGIEDVPDLVLNRGTLRLDLKPLSGESEFKTDVPGGQVILYNATAKVTVAKEKGQQKFELCLFDGNATVAMNGGSVDVKQGEGVRIIGNEPPQAVRILPEAPTVLLPLNNQTVMVGKTDFSWKSETVNTELQFSTEPDFKTFVSQNHASYPQLTMMLDPGVYFWRVVPMDDDGMEGRPSETRRIIVTSEVVTPSIMQEKIKAVAKGDLMAKLKLTCATDTTIEDDNVYEISGEVDLGSKVFINSWPIKSNVQNGVFSEKVQLFRGENIFRTSVYALNGLENSEFVNVRYLPKKKLRIGLSLTPLIPVALTNYQFGLGAQLNATYKLSNYLVVKAGVGGAGIGVDSKAFGASGTDSEYKISSIFMIDLGLAYDFLSEATVVPYAEAGLGFTSWYASSSLVTKDHTTNMFSPGIGLGVRFEGEDEHAFGLGAYYRFLIDSDKELDQSENSSLHGLVEIRLTLWF